MVYEANFRSCGTAIVQEKGEVDNGGSEMDSITGESAPAISKNQ
jgi:hypothetical protein